MKDLNAKISPCPAVFLFKGSDVGEAVAGHHNLLHDWSVIITNMRQIKAKGL